MTGRSFTFACARRRVRGAAMVEFGVAAVVLITVGLTVVQYGMLYFAKNNLNYAAFEAARAGATGHARVADIQSRFARALTGLYGGGRNAAELAESYARALADVTAHSRVEIINPTREAFEFNDPRLQQRLADGFDRVDGARARVIPNAALHLRADAGEIGAASGMNRRDANLLKLRITYGYQPRIPVASNALLGAWGVANGFSPPTDPYHATLLAAGRIPVVIHATLRMESEPVENVAMVRRSGGPGGGMGAVDPPEPPPAEPPPRPSPTPPPTPPGNPGHTPPAPNPPPPNPPPGEPECPNGITVVENLPSDVLFEFGSSSLNDGGRRMLDDVLSRVRGRDFDSLALIGHTDHLGSDAINNPLSVARATAVRDYLTSHGLPNRSITVEGRGSREPVVQPSACTPPPSGQTQQQCLAPNRRVALVFSGV